MSASLLAAPCPHIAHDMALGPLLLYLPELRVLYPRLISRGECFYLKRIMDEKNRKIVLLEDVLITNYERTQLWSVKGYICYKTLFHDGYKFLK